MDSGTNTLWGESHPTPHPPHPNWVKLVHAGLKAYSPVRGNPMKVNHILQWVTLFPLKAHCCVRIKQYKHHHAHHVSVFLCEIHICLVLNYMAHPSTHEVRFLCHISKLMSKASGQDLHITFLFLWCFRWFDLRGFPVFMTSIDLTAAG